MKRFEKALAQVGEEFRTEVEALVRRRLGQTEFRAGLLDYWQGSCAVTGIAQPELLRASHIKPWAHCGNNAERLDVYNGFLLTADWDAAFDAGLVSFDTDGVAVFSPALSPGSSHPARRRPPPRRPPINRQAQAILGVAWHEKSSSADRSAPDNFARVEHRLGLTDPFCFETDMAVASANVPSLQRLTRCQALCLPPHLQFGPRKACHVPPDERLN